MKKLVISRHNAFLQYLLQKGIVRENEYEVIPHISDSSLLKGKDIITSGLPLHLCSLANSVTIVTLNLPQELRGKELSIQDMQKYCTGIKTYKVKEI